MKGAVKMTTRRKISATLLIALVTLLMGCASGKIALHEPNKNSGSIAATMPSESMHESINKDWVITAITENYSWVDGAGNQNVVHIRLPHINFDLPFAVEFNNHIESYATEVTTEVEECVAGAFSTHIVAIDYEAWKNGDTLSILITTNTATDYVEYQVWNFDLDDGKISSTADMCNEYLDLEYPQFLKYITDMIMQEFQVEFADFIKAFPGEYEFMRNLYLSDRLITKNYRLFLNEEGKLMLVADRPSIAGAMSYGSISEMTVNPDLVPGKVDGWNWLFDLYLGSDADNEAYAAELLRIAYEGDEDDFTAALQQRASSEIEEIQAALRVKESKEG